MNYIIAGAFSKFNDLSLYILRHKPHKRYGITVYDGIMSCSWNGGRINRDIEYKDSQIEFYYNRGIGIALTFSNPEIDLDDVIGNNLLDKFHRDGNRIILINEELRNYIRKYYPRYELTYSITGMGNINIPMRNDDLKFYRDLELKYDLIVPRMEHVFDSKFEELDQSKYEILLNDTCIWNCPYYKEHFELIAKQNTIAHKPWEELGHDECFKIEECWLPKFDPSIESQYDGMDISKSKIEELKLRGIEHFKISGRELVSEEFIIELNTFL